MKNLVIIFIFIFINSSIALAQNDELRQRLQGYGITQEVLTEHLKDGEGNYKYTLTSTSFADTDTTVHVSTFDPTKKAGERWTLVSVDGNEPSKFDRKNFNKIHNPKKTKGVSGKIDDGSWKVEKETDQELVVSFRYAEDAMPKKYSYLRECEGRVFIDKKSGQLKKVEYTNDTPVKVKILKVNNLSMEVDYRLQPEGTTYLIDKEVLKMDTELLGQEVSVTEINEFSDYQKI